MELFRPHFRDKTVDIVEKFDIESIESVGGSCYSCSYTDYAGDLRVAQYFGDIFVIPFVEVA